MTKDRIYLSSPHMGGRELDYIQEAFRDNWIAPMGPNVTVFEDSLTEYLGGKNHVVALNSGTAAIHLALILMGVERGDEVICQSMTFAASANPIVYQGATPIFIDSEIDSWNMSPEFLEVAIKDRISKGKKPKAIIAVHLYGMPFNVDKIIAIAKKYEIALIEDCAGALGSKFRNQQCGTFGDISILSFNGNKIITTSGGGALVSKDLNIKNKAIFLATQACDNAPHYEHSEIGYNYRLSNICAGIGRGQLKVLDSRVELRRSMNQFYKDLFSNTDAVSVFTEPDDRFFSNHWLTCLLIEDNIVGYDKQKFIDCFAKDNIESRPLWKPMHLQPIYREAPYYGGLVAQNLFENGLCVPSGSNLQSAHKQRIQKALVKFL